jgi:hypothetical protein
MHELYLLNPSPFIEETFPFQPYSKAQAWEGKVGMPCRANLIIDSTARKLRERSFVSLRSEVRLHGVLGRFVSPLHAACELHTLITSGPKAIEDPRARNFFGEEGIRKYFINSTF